MDEIQLAKEIRTAIKQGSLEKVKSLIGNDAERLRMKTVFGTWVHVAASLGQLNIVKWLIESGADINAIGGISGGKPINEAAEGGHFEIVDFLISHKADLDVDVSECNPLFTAIYGGHTAVAKLLIDSGIDTRVKYTGENMKNMDALAFASEWGRKEIAEYLISHQTKKSFHRGKAEF